LAAKAAAVVNDVKNVALLAVIIMWINLLDSELMV
jgi:hypothetical protein